MVRPKKKRGSKRRRPSPSGVRLQEVPGANAWEFVHPRCVRDRAEDMEEVRDMLEAGEYEIAQEELRWLLEGCPDFIEAHCQLGEIALAGGDVKLARAHFGYAWHIGANVLSRAPITGPLKYDRAANQAFFEAGKGLAHCLMQIDRRDLAEDVVRTLMKCDPSDPLNVAAVLKAPSE